MGPGVARNFAYKFHGDEVIGARRALAASRALRTADGTWVELYVDTPSGGRAKLYLGLDQSARQRKTIAVGKELFQSFKDTSQRKFAEGKYHLLRNECVINYNWQHLAKVVVTPDDWHGCLQRWTFR